MDQNNLPMDDGSGVREFWDRIEGKKSFGLFGKKEPENMPVPLSSERVEPKPPSPVPQAELPMDDGTGVRNFWAQQEKPKSFGLGVTSKEMPSNIGRRVFADPLVGLTRGALVGIPEAATGLLDVATLGQVGFGKAYEKATTALGLGDFKSQNEYFNQLLSDETREAQRKVSEAKGFIDTTFTALTNPSAIVQTVAQSIPPMVSGARLGGAIAGLTKWAPELVGKAAEAEAFAAKTAGIKEGIRQALLGNPKEAAKFFEEGAKRAKDILSQGEKDILKRWATIGGIAEGAVTAGQNLSQVRGEAPEGEVTATQALTMGFSGALTGLIGVAGGRLAARMGITDFDTLAAAGRKGFVADKELGIFKRLIGGAIQEGIFEELPQSIQEQMAQNIAQGKPISEGALEAGAMGMLAGFAQSMGVNVAQKTWEKVRAKSDPTTQKLDEDIKKLNLDFSGIMDVPEALETKDYKSTFGITPKGFTPTEIPPATPPPSTPPPAGGGGNLGGVGIAPTAPSGAPTTVDEVFKKLAEGREGVPPLLTERTGQLQQGEVEGKPQVKKAVPGEGLGVGRKNVTPEEYAGGLTPIEKKRFETRKEEAAKRLANPKRGTKEKAAKDVAESGYEYNPAVMVDGKIYTYGAIPTPAETKKGLHGPIMDNIPGIRGAKDVQIGYVDKQGNFRERLPEKPVESPVKAVEAPAKAEAPVEPAKVENAVNLRDNDVIDSVVTVLKSKQFRFGAEEAKARVKTVIGQIGNDQVTMETLLKSSIAGKYVKPTTKATIPPVTSPVVSAEEATKRRQEFEKSIEKPVSSEPKAIEAPVTPVTPVKPNLEAASKVLREQTQSKKDFNTKLESAALGTTFIIAEGKHAGTWTKLKKVWKNEKGMTVSKDYGKLFGNRDEIEKTLTLPQAKAPTAGKMKGPQNLVSYIQSLGHLKATGDLASKMGSQRFVKGKGWVNTGKMTVKEQGDLGKVVRIEGKLNLDEFVQDLHETFPNPKGGQWTADDLVEALISGQARNIKPAEIGYEDEAEKAETKWAEEQAAIEADKPPILKVALPKNESEFLRLVLAHELPGTKSEAGGKEYTHDGDYWNVNGKYISRNDLFDYLEKNNLLQEFLENFEVAELEVPVPYFESHFIDENRYPPTDMDMQNALSALPDGSIVTVFRDPGITRIPITWWEYKKIDAMWHLNRIDGAEIDDKNEIAEKYNIEKIIKSEDLNAWAVEFGGYLSFDTKSKQILLELSATNKDIMNLMRIPRKPDWQDEEAKSFKAVSFNPEEIEKQKEIASVVEEAVKDAPQAIVDIEKQGRDVLDKKAELEKEDQQIIENSKEEGLGGLEKSAKLFVQGDKVVVSGQRGTVVSVNGPLVRVHFNHMPAKGFTDCPASIVFHDDGAAEYFAAVEGELEKEKKGRGRKKKEEDITEDSSGYNMKLESDNTKLILILGRQQYGASLGKVLLKEMLQNSFDTIKEAVYKGVYKAGNLTIRINDMKRTVEFIDDGMGMSAKTLREAFFTIGGSQKDVPPELASGGLGLAKMALFTSAEKIRVETTQAGETEKRVCEVTAIELIKSGDKDGKPFKVEKQTSEKSEHGTSVKLWIPESFMIDGKYVYISFPSYDSGVWDSSIMTRPLLGPINVNVEHYDVLAGKYEKIALDIGEKTDNTALPPFRYKVNCPDWGWMDVYYGEERKSNPVHQVLSSGIYQFHHDFTDSKNNMIPYDITINVFSKVKTDHNYYPFNNTRESWRSSISADIEGLTAYLLRIARGNEAEELLENFKDVVSLPMFDWEALLTKTGDEFEKAMSEYREQTRKSLGLKQNEISEKDKEEAKKKIEKSNYKEIEITKNGVDAVESETPPVPTSVAPPQPPPPVPPPPPKKKNIMTPSGVKDAIKNETHKAKNIDIEGEIKDPKQFLIDIGATTKAPIFHSNLNKDFTTIATKGNALDFFSKLGSIVVEMKRDLSNSNIAGFGKDLEEEWYAGVSLDKEYGGLWLVVPYRVIYLNPLYTLGREPQTFSGLAEYLYKAAIHEFAHMTASGHGEWHNQVQMMLEIHMADSGLKDYYINAFRQVSAEYFELWRELSNEFDKSTTQNVGRGLKEHEGKRLARGSALSRTNNLASESNRALSERHSIEPPYPGDQRLREDRGISDTGRYSARDREAIRQTGRKTVKNVDLKQIQELFGSNVKVLQHGSKYFIETKSGHFLSVNNVSEITPNETIFEFNYGRKFDPEKEEIIGDYDNGTIRLVKDKSGKWTLAHESIHWMEDVGILSKQDIAILKAHIKKLAAEGKFKPESKRNIGNAEDRANFIADQLVAPTKKGFVGKVLDKVRSFIDGIRSFLGMKPTAEGIVRAVKSGKVYEGAKTKPQVFSGYAVRKKEEKGDIQETLPGLSDEENFQLTPEGEVYRGPVQPKKKEPEQGRLFAARKKPQNLKDRINLYNEKLQADFKALNEIIKNPRPVGNSRAEIDRYLGEIQITEHSLTALAKEISKELPKERQHAISRWMRAGGDMSLLREWAKKYPGDKSYKDALSLTKDEKEWADFFIKQIENDANLALRSGLSRSFAINYMKDAIFSDVAKQKIYATVESPLMQTDPEKAMKYILKELGKAPKSIGASFIASRRALHDSMSLKAMLTRLSKTKEEDGRYTLIIGGAGKPLKKEDQERLKKVDEKFLAKENIREMNRSTRDYRMFEHPSMFGHIYYDLDENEKQTFYAGDFRVHPAAYSKINALLGKSLIRSWKIPKWIPFIGGMKPGKMALKAGAWIKGTMLGMSPFHLTHTGSHAIFHDVNPFNLKEIDFEKRPLLREGVNHGLLLIDRHAMDVFREGLAAGGLWNSLPTKAGRWVGETHEQFTKFTFENMIPRMKADVFEKTVAHMEKKFAKELASGQMTRDQMLYIAAATSNNAFGGQNYRSMGRNPTLVDAIRLILLAPDFLESRLKFFGQALTRYGTESRTALIKSAIYMSVLAQIANVLIGDDKRMHWEKPFTVIAGGREWTPRSVAGDMIHLVTDWRNFAYNRLNPLFGKPGAEIVTGRDRLGRKMEPDEIVQSALKGWVPIPLQGAVREPGTELLDSLRNTMFQAVGLSNYPYRSQFDREVQEAFQKRIVISAPPEDRKRLALVRKFGNEMKRLREENKPITDVYMKMHKAVQNKEMFKEDIKLAYQRAKQNTTMVELKSLQAEDLAKLWGYATPEERQMYNRIKKTKFKNLRENHPERYSKLREKYPEVFQTSF